MEINSISEAIVDDGRVVKLGDTVWTPAGSSDPAAAKVCAILPISWPTVPPGDQELGLLLRFVFGGNQDMFSLVPVNKCE
jgi:hypothetical protein